MVEVEGRNIAALLNPRPVVLVTSCDINNKPNVLTVAWTMPVSHDPPLLALSISPTHHSHALLAETGECVVNIVGQQFAHAVEVCGNTSGAHANKFELAGLKTAESLHVRPPRIHGCLAYMECRIVRVLNAGDHSLLLADVVWAEATKGAFSDVWDTEQGDVLLCRQRDRFGVCKEISAGREVEQWQ